jgi:hypothetical protein
MRTIIVFKVNYWFVIITYYTHTTIVYTRVYDRFDMNRRLNDRRKRVHDK